MENGLVRRPLRAKSAETFLDIVLPAVQDAIKQRDRALLQGTAGDPAVNVQYVSRSGEGRVRPRWRTAGADRNGAQVESRSSRSPRSSPRHRWRTCCHCRAEQRRAEHPEGQPCCRKESDSTVRGPSYLQNGQQPPEAATLVAAAAVVPNSATAAVTNARSFAFMDVLLCADDSRLLPKSRTCSRHQGQGLQCRLTFKPT